MLQNLDRLKVFFHVFSGESVMAAAKSLHVSQSAISQSLQKLESEIKTPLFTRLHKRLVPTAAAEQLFAIVQPFMVELDICLKTLKKAKDKPFGKLRIGAPVEFGKAYFPAIVAGFRERYPEVTFYIELGDAGTLLPMVARGQIDFALVDVFLTQNPFVGNLDIYHFKPVVEEEVILACSRRYYERSIRQDHSFTSLAKQNFITYRDDAQTLKNWFKHHFGKFNPSFHRVLTVDSLQTVINAIHQHLGLGIVASHLVNEEILRGEIVPINTSKAAIINQISLIYLKDKTATLTEEVFQQFLMERIKLIGI
jgi:DNA-binding transcriptional LysR family regulator